MKVSSTERRFWRFWLAGLALLGLMIAMNAMITKGQAQASIAAHQIAGTAAKVDAIQSAWLSGGVLPWARLSIVIDLLFIGVYSWGAWNGAKLMRSHEKPMLRAIGLLVMLATAAFCLADYAETVSQFIQVVQMKGSDTLAGIAAAVQPVKMSAFIVTVVGLVAALLLRRFAR